MTDSLWHDWKKALYLYSPVVACLILYFALASLPCYSDQRGLIVLMVNYVLSEMALNLMLHNMTGKPFSPLQPMLLVPLAPLVAYHMGVTGEAERLLPQVLTLLVWIIFIVKMTIIGTQWTDFA